MYMSVERSRLKQYTILSFIHFKGYRQHSCFRQLFKTNYLIEWLAVSHGCLWRMYQLKKKTLPILLPSVVEAENFSDHPRRDQWQVGTAVLMIIHVFWNTAPGRLVNSIQRREELADTIVRVQIVQVEHKSWGWGQQTFTKCQQLYTNRRCVISQNTVIFSDGMLWTPTVV